MGAFDQFKDKASEFADKAKGSAGDQRDKAASSDDSRDMERGTQQDQEQEQGMRGKQDRRSDVQDPSQDRLGSESSDADQDDWA